MKLTRSFNAFIGGVLCGSVIAAGATGSSVAFAQSEPLPVTATIGAARKAPVLLPGNGLTLTGAMGLVLNPTAQIPNPGEFRIQGDYVNLGSIENNSQEFDLGLIGGVGSFNAAEDETGDFKFRALHGATRLGRARLELNGGIEDMKAGGNEVLNGSGTFSDLSGNTFSFDLTTRVNYDEMDRTRGAIGIKYLVTRNPNPDAAHVAIGGGFNPALFGNRNLYITATKPFKVGGRRIRAHVGARYDRFRFESTLRTTGNFVFTPILGVPTVTPFNFATDFSEQSRKYSLYAGMELPIDRRGRFTFVGEIGSKNSEFDNDDDTNILADTGLPTSKFPFAAALRYGGQDGLGATVGVMRQGVLDDSSFFAQLGYGF